MKLGRVLILILAFIPGLGHIAAGRCLRGVAIFFFFSALANGSFLITLMVPGPASADMSMAFGIVAALFWIYAYLDALRIVVWRHLPGLRRRKDELFRLGLAHYLRNEHAAARRRFRDVLRLDHDDADAYFHLAMVYKAEGREFLARRALLFCRAKDDDGKWKDPLRQEIGLLRGRNGRKWSDDEGA